jgi:hypothetical protein
VRNRFLLIPDACHVDATDLSEEPVTFSHLVSGGFANAIMPCGQLQPKVQGAGESECLDMRILLQSNQGDSAFSQKKPSPLYVAPPTEAACHAFVRVASDEAQVHHMAA